MMSQGTAATIATRPGLPDGGLAGSAPALPMTAVLRGIVPVADTNVVVHDDAAVLDLARQVVGRRLGSGDGGNDGEG